jgi:hypothetical protein
MGANAGTAVPTYASGDVLTAANLNLTNSGAPVFADTSARDGAFGSGKKTLAEGQLCYLEDADVVQYYDGSSWATVGPAADSGLTLISTTTIGSAVSSVTVSNAFSATYDNYLITVSGGAASTAGFGQMTLGVTGTGYYYGINLVQYGGAGSVATLANGAYWYVGQFEVAGFGTTIELMKPFLSDETSVSFRGGGVLTTGQHFVGSGFLNNTTSYTAFTITHSGGTMTGGTVRVYGYKN